MKHNYIQIAYNGKLYKLNKAKNVTFIEQSNNLQMLDFVYKDPDDYSFSFKADDQYYFENKYGQHLVSKDELVIMGHKV